MDSEAERITSGQLCGQLCGPPPLTGTACRCPAALLCSLACSPWRSCEPEYLVETKRTPGGHWAGRNPGMFPLPIIVCLGVPGCCGRTFTHPTQPLGNFPSGGSHHLQPQPGLARTFPTPTPRTSRQTQNCSLGSQGFSHPKTPSGTPFLTPTPKMSGYQGEADFKEEKDSSTTGILNL